MAIGAEANMTANELKTERVQAVVRALPSLIHNEPGAPPWSERHQELKEILADFYRVAEIAHYVRRGGVKAMIYRLETGKTKFVASDYFDEAHERLTATYQNLGLKPEAEEPKCLLDRLRAITPEEEAAVTAVLPDLETFLLLQKRIEAVSVDES